MTSIEPAYNGPGAPGPVYAAPHDVEAILQNEPLPATPPDPAATVNLVKHLVVVTGPLRTCQTDLGFNPEAPQADGRPNRLPGEASAWN